MIDISSGEHTPVGGTGTVCNGVSAAEIRFRAVFPDAKLDSSNSLNDVLTVEYDSAITRHDRSAGFVFAANTHPECGEEVPPLEDTFRESLRRSIDAPPADE